MIIWTANVAIGRLAQALKLDDPNLEIRLAPQVIAARCLLWHCYTPSSLIDDRTEWLKPSRHEVRKEIRAKLTAAAVELHHQRHYPE